MSNSRQAILDRLISRVVPPVPLPEIDTARLVHYHDLAHQFCQVLQSVGGNVHRVASADQVAGVLAAQPHFDPAGRIASMVPKVVASTVDVRTLARPHQLADLDWSVIEGQLGVAENGAVWVDHGGLPHRVMPFIPQHLALILRGDQLVPHMHAAYQRLGTLGRGAGVFISGPSKTADIEQSLVIGAHGCRSLHLFLLG